MTVHDLLYGRIQIPSVLDRLVAVPEVRRLSQIRLLNCLSPSLSSLGEVRRFSHTLGVLHLWTKLRRHSWSVSEFDALGAAILLHDIGTPPFGHLLEYQLRERYGWSHEAIIHGILWGHAVPEDKAHQIFAGRAAQFRRELARTGISLEQVDLIVSGQHPLSVLLFGSLDLDNLDNVGRMAAYLGLKNGGGLAQTLAASLEVTFQGQLLLPKAARGSVREWMELRREVYEIVVFDTPTVAAQSVLSDAIRAAFDAGDLTRDDWSLTDEDLLRKLNRMKSCKAAVSLEYLGVLPELVCCVQVAGAVPVPDWYSRSLQDCVLEIARDAIGDSGVRAYVFQDRGTFSKHVTFVDHSGEGWSEGEKSSSVVIHVFAPRGKTISRERRRTAMDDLIRRLGVPPRQVVRAFIETPSTNADQKLTF